MFNLQNKTIIITGAGSGIGRATAVIASKLGANVVMLDLSETGLKETFSELEGSANAYYVIDLADTNAIGDLVSLIVGRYSKINGLVHCAGISSRKPLSVLSKAGFSKVMDINFFAFVELVKQVTKKKNFVDGGSIVVVSSISSIRGYKAKTEYCVSKAAVDAFVRCMALELAGRKIRINSVMPAEVLTPLTLKAKEINRSIGAQEFNAPLGSSDPYEVANTIVFLLSDATKTITGTSIIIDGGALLSSEQFSGESVTI